MDARDAWRPGAWVGEHQLVDLLGRGGMGEVWRVVHGPTGAARALKVVDGLADAEALLRFQREVEALGRVDGHPHLVRAHAAGVHAGRPWVVTELVAGGDLAGRLARGPLGPREAAALARDLARAVAHAHACGVLHRDLKPANVLLDGDGRARLVDFGLARLTGRGALTATGAFLGSPAWTSPEQARGAPASELSDVYGLGAVLYHALAGRAPADAPAPLASLAAAAAGRLPPLRALRPDVPPGLAGLCARALAREPDARWRSAAAFADALDAWLATGEPSARPVRRVAAAAALAALAAAALVALAARGESAAPDSRALPAGPPGADSAAAGSPGAADLGAATDGRSPPAPGASGSSGAGGPDRPDWGARVRAGEPAAPRPDTVAVGMVQGHIDSLLALEPGRLPPEDVAKLEQYAKDGIAEAQELLGRHLAARGARSRAQAREALWAASREPGGLTGAGVLLGLHLREAGDAEGAAWLFAEAAERARRTERADACAHVAVQSARSAAPADLGRALRLLRARRDACDPSQLERRPRSQAAQDVGRVLAAIALHEGWAGAPDPEGAADALAEVLADRGSEGAAVAKAWLERHPVLAARRRPLVERGLAREEPRLPGLLDVSTDADDFQRLARPSLREVDWEERLRAGERAPRPTIDAFAVERAGLEALARRVWDGATTPRDRAVLAELADLGVAHAQRLHGRVLSARAPDEAARALWLASRPPGAELWAGVDLAALLRAHGAVEGARWLCAEAAARVLREPTADRVAQVAVEAAHGPAETDLARALRVLRADVSARRLRVELERDPRPVARALLGVELVERGASDEDRTEGAARLREAAHGADPDARRVARLWVGRRRDPALWAAVDVPPAPGPDLLGLEDEADRHFAAHLPE